MPTIFKSQSNFTLGELSPTLYSRTDFDGYYKGARKVRNLLVIPQGGLRRRFGMKYITQITGVTSAEQFRIYNISINDVDEYLLVFTNLSLKIYFEGALVATVVTVFGTSDLPIIKFAQSNESLIIVKGDQPPQVLTRTVRHTGWTIGDLTFRAYPTYDFLQNYDNSQFSLAALTGENIQVTITGGTSAFLPAHVGGVLVADGTGVGRIISYTSSTVVHIDIERDFTDATFNGTRAYLAQPAWSTALGWPTCVTFYQNRLVFGNTTSLSGGVWLSVTNQYTNFNEFLATGADSAISVFIQSKGVNTIKDILGIKSLIIFTTDGEYSDGGIQSGGVTADNFFVTQQTSTGISDVVPVYLDNQIIFVDDGGQLVESMQYSIQTNSFQTTSISIFSEQLINSPVYSTLYRNPSVDDGKYLFLVNGDGTLATFQSVLAQKVQGWSLQTTTAASGKFVESTGLKNFCWFATQRTINGSTVFYVEQLDFNYLMDCALKFTYGVPTSVITGLSHLEGQTVKIIADGNVLPDEVVVGGQITIDKEATDVEVGLDYTDQIELTLMPLNVQTQTGNDLYSPKHINTVYVDYMDSLGITVNGVELKNMQLDLSTLGQAPSLQSGFQAVSLMTGWDPFFEVTISQSGPAYMMIRGVGLEVQLEDSP